MSTISSGTTLTTAIQIIGDTTGNLTITTGSANTVAMTIDNSQNVAFANAVTYNGTVVFSGGLTGNGAGLTSLNGSNVTSGTISVSRGGTGLSSVGTAGNVLTSNGTAWTSAPAAAFDSGTVMLFAQTTAPTGWTKNTSTGNNSALRVVTGTASTGGSVAFTTAFASQTPAGSVSINTSGLSAGATTLSTDQIPSHTHTIGNAGDGSESPLSARYGASPTATYNSGSTGGGNSHSHSISGSATGSFTGTAINLAVQYIDVIRATKD
jgi:hypothetical protein